MLGGRRYGGLPDFFAGSPATRFEIEEMFGAGDRVIVRWRYTWADGHVRGVDVLRVRAGQVAGPWLVKG